MLSCVVVVVGVGRPYTSAVVELEKMPKLVRLDSPDSEGGVTKSSNDCSGAAAAGTGAAAVTGTGLSKMGDDEHTSE